MPCRQGTNSLSYVISSPHTVYCETYAIRFFFSFSYPRVLQLTHFPHKTLLLPFRHLSHVSVIVVGITPGECDCDTFFADEMNS